MEEHGIAIYKLGSLNMKFFGYEDCSQVRQSTCTNSSYWGVCMVCRCRYGGMEASL